jgi:predicted ATPase
MFNIFILFALMSDSSNNQNSEVFIGRQETIKQLFDNINNNVKSVTLLSGESGVGKSTVLDEFYRLLTTPTEIKRYSHYSLFVGYYDKSKAVLTRSEFLIYPFNIALAMIIKSIKELQTTNEKKDIIVNRLKNAFSSFLKEEGNEIAKAIIEDAATKAGFGSTFKMATTFRTRFLQ